MDLWDDVYFQMDDEIGFNSDKNLTIQPPHCSPK